MNNPGKTLETRPAACLRRRRGLSCWQSSERSRAGRPAAAPVTTIRGGSDGQDIKNGPPGATGVSPVSSSRCLRPAPPNARCANSGATGVSPVSSSRCLQSAPPNARCASTSILSRRDSPMPCRVPYGSAERAGWSRLSLRVDLVVPNASTGGRNTGGTPVAPSRMVRPSVLDAAGSRSGSTWWCRRQAPAEEALAGRQWHPAGWLNRACWMQPALAPGGLGGVEDRHRRKKHWRDASGTPAT